MNAGGLGSKGGLLPPICKPEGGRPPLQVLESIGPKCSAEGRAEGINWMAVGAVEPGLCSVAGHLPDLMQVCVWVDGWVGGCAPLPDLMQVGRG